MEKAKFTPGPWHIGMKPGPIVYGSKGEQVALMQVPMLELDEHKANARLIAAAPAMYKALKLAHKELDNLRNGIKPLSGDVQRAEVNVRAAIAKATE